MVPTEFNRASNTKDFNSGTNRALPDSDIWMCLIRCGLMPQSQSAAVESALSRPRVGLELEVSDLPDLADPPDLADLGDAFTQSTCCYAGLLKLKHRSYRRWRGWVCRFLFGTN